MAVTGVDHAHRMTQDHQLHHMISSGHLHFLSRALLNQQRPPATGTETDLRPYSSRPGSVNQPPATVKVTLINSCISCLNKLHSESGGKQKRQLANE